MEIIYDGLQQQEILNFGLFQFHIRILESVNLIIVTI